MLPPWPQLAGFALEGATAVLARAIAKRRAYHSPYARYALFLAVVDPLRALIQALRVTPVHHPLVGVERALYTASATLYGAVAMAFALAAVAICARALSTHALGLAAAALIVPIAIYPLGAGRPSIVAVHACAVAAAILAGALGWRDDEWPTPTHYLLVVVVAVQTALLFGPLIDTGSFATTWERATPLLFGGQIAAIGIQAVWLRDLKRG